MLKDLHEESVVLTMVKQHLRNTMFSDEKSQDVKDYAGELYNLIKAGLSKNEQ